MGRHRHRMSGATTVDHVPRRDAQPNRGTGRAPLDPTLLWRWTGGVETYASMKSGFKEAKAEAKGLRPPTFLTPAAVLGEAVLLQGFKDLREKIGLPFDALQMRESETAV